MKISVTQRMQCVNYKDKRLLDVELILNGVKNQEGITEIHSSELVVIHLKQVMIIIHYQIHHIVIDIHHGQYQEIEIEIEIETEKDHGKVVEVEVETADGDNIHHRHHDHQCHVHQHLIQEVGVHIIQNHVQNHDHDHHHILLYYPMIHIKDGVDRERGRAQNHAQNQAQNQKLKALEARNGKHHQKKVVDQFQNHHVLHHIRCQDRDQGIVHGQDQGQDLDQERGEIEIEKETDIHQNQREDQNLNLNQHQNQNQNPPHPHPRHERAGNRVQDEVVRKEGIKVKVKEKIDLDLDLALDPNRVLYQILVQNDIQKRVHLRLH
mmetsp:Transcript_41260/g.36450  ORF Transcript_41260/g.36450 Transcript_41260/m.36450 type:complete len:322 (-) Transcript_41260:364-1329(-)